MVNIFTNAELSFFHANGFLVKRGFIGKEDCENVVDIAWKYLPENFELNDKKTWKGQVTCSCNITQDLRFRRGHVKIQKDKIGKYSLVRDLLAENVNVAAAVQELIGSPLCTPIFRGLYFTFPIPKLFAFPHYGHLESHSFQVGVIAYCSSVKKNGGGINVWPGSHWKFHSSFNRKIGFFSNPNYHAVAKLLNEKKPFTIEGEVGDVIFTHHRLFHSPSSNTSNIPRSALFCDFKGKNWKDLERESSLHDPFEAFNGFDLINKQNTKNLLVEYDSEPEPLRLLSAKYPLINKLYGKLTGNKTTIERSALSFDARFDK